MEEAYRSAFSGAADCAQRLAALEAENKELRAKLAAAVESGAMLEDCIVEMAGVVYA